MYETITFGENSLIIESFSFIFNSFIGLDYKSGTNSSETI